MINSIYSVLMSDKLEESSGLDKTIFNFTETFSSDWYISLLHPEWGISHQFCKS